MSFLNKIKGWGQKDEAPLLGEAAVAVPTFDELRASNESHAATEHPTVDAHAAAAYDAVPTQQQPVDDTSIISEAAPSEMADFSETRLQDSER
ncbi:MAG: hypothetical protein ABUL50_10670, partial [Rhizobacter sp.]